MQLFYNPDIHRNDHHFTFDKTESRHIIKVLRKSEGDEICITNGSGALIISKIVSANDKRCKVEIVRFQEKEKDRKYSLHIAIAPTKLNDRYEWFLEKACEIGIDEITPIICERSERKFVKHERMLRIIESACKQSLKYHFPTIHPAVTFKEFIQSKKEGDLFIAHCENSEKKPLKNALKAARDITILIGPEGDFSPKEISLSLDNHYIPVSLGNSRLRTETAGIVAVHSVSFINE